MMRNVVGACAFYTLGALLCEFLPLNFLFVQSHQQKEGLRKQNLTHSNNEDRRSRQLLKTTTRRDGEWVITQEIKKNNFALDFVPEGPIINVTDYDQYRDIHTKMMYDGKIYLNAWASDEDFDVAPRFVERYSGIKYASIFKRFERSEQAYGYTFTDYNISKEDGETRTIMVDATKFGRMCIQEGIDEKYMNEDCLYLNIWRPSRWKQSVNTTSKCKNKFLGGGMLKKLCEIITVTRTIKADGSIVVETNTNKTSEIVPMTLMRGQSRSLLGEDEDFLESGEWGEISESEGGSEGGIRDLQSVKDQLDSALDNLEQGLNDLKEELESSDSEDDKKPNGGTNKEDEALPALGTYNVDGSGLLPVMVYIHGGGFMEGSGNDPMFDGSKVAGRGQVILVTMNYRLGVFGFLPSFGWDQWKVNGGMNGFMDIVEALTWINRNIIKWGGNPDKVTVFGSSSTPAVCLLTMCPAAAGLFQRAILQSSTRATEVKDGRLVTDNGANGASCLLSSQEPYQPLEGRIEISYKFFDYINETYYNFPENPDPTREDIIDWLKAFALNSTALLNASLVEGTVFFENRPDAYFDYNRDESITYTQKRRTFMTWDNDIFPQMPIDLETSTNPIDILVGVRGKSTDERLAPSLKLPETGGNGNNGNDVEVQSSNEGENTDNIFNRNEDKFERRLEEAQPDPVPGSGGEDDDDYFDFYNMYYDDDTLFDEEVDKTICQNYSQYHWPVWGNEAEKYKQKNFGNKVLGNTTFGNKTLLECRYDFSGTTSDQELCVNKQFAEIMARNIEGNVYGYVIDDSTELHGYHRRKLMEARRNLYQKHWEIEPGRSRNLRIRQGGFDHDLETLYFFDNFQIGNNYGWRKEEVKMQKELFNRWVNFAKTGLPVVTKRTAAKAARYVTWDPFPKGNIGLDTNRVKTSTDSYTPKYLYLSAGREGKRRRKKSRMVSLEELLSHRTLWKYPNNAGSSDVCSWVLNEENDYDEDYFETLLDFNANTAFEYYVTIPATLNPTIEYVPDREYLVKMPPTMAPSSLENFINQSLHLEMSSSPPSLTRKAIASTFTTVLSGTVTMLIAELLTF